VKKTYMQDKSIYIKNNIQLERDWWTPKTLWHNVCVWERDRDRERDSLCVKFVWKLEMSMWKLPFSKEKIRAYPRWWFLPLDQVYYPCNSQRI